MTKVQNGEPTVSFKWVVRGEAVVELIRLHVDCNWVTCRSAFCLLGLILSFIISTDAGFVQALEIVVHPWVASKEF